MFSSHLRDFIEVTVKVLKTFKFPIYVSVQALGTG